MPHIVDYVEVAIQMGVVGQKPRDVYTAIQTGVKEVSAIYGPVKLINKPGSIIENPPNHPIGSYRVQKNTTLLPLNIEDVNANISQRVGKKKRAINSKGDKKD